MSRAESVSETGNLITKINRKSVDPATRPAVKFDPVKGGLPLALESQCLFCECILSAEMKNGDGVFLEKECPDHGPQVEKLNDIIFTQGISDWPESPSSTLSGHPINPVVRYLPKTVETLCPECARNIVGRVFDWQGDVYMEKTCPEHGYVKDRVSTNTELFLKCQQWSFREGAGLENPNVRDARSCPSDCGLCNQHQSHTMLGQIDLTNRCNLSCPICFANANVRGSIYEPEFDEIVRQLEQLQAYRPVPATAVQFSGGEPTIYPRFFDVIRRARDMGFSHIQIASNGLSLVDPDFAYQCAEAGLHTVYLQFDGVDDEIYKITRGRELMDAKLRALENISNAGMKACLVATIVRGINDDQVPKILQFALKNIHIISAVIYQPVAFTGRISNEEREAQRYTQGDLAKQLEETGYINAMRDFYPLSMIAPISRLFAAASGNPKITATSHPTCSIGTYFVVDKYKNAVPVTKVFDIEGLLSEIDKIAERMNKSIFKWWYKSQIPGLFKKYYIPGAAPEGMSVKAFMWALKGMADKKIGRGEAGKKTYRTLVVASMHFQDRYNYDVERVKRCVIHYSTPEGMFPFCAYNSGPVHRERVEKNHSITIEDWSKRRKNNSIQI